MLTALREHERRGSPIMRSFLSVIVVFLIVLVVACLFGSFGSYTIGDGHFDQELVIDTDKPIERVNFSCYVFGPETRQLLEKTADPDMVLCYEAARVSDDRFKIWVPVAVREGLLRHNVSYPPHLAVFVEFAGGTRACRVIDIPPGQGKELIEIHLR